MCPIPRSQLPGNEHLGKGVCQTDKQSSNWYVRLTLTYLPAETARIVLSLSVVALCIPRAKAGVVRARLQGQIKEGSLTIENESMHRPLPLQLCFGTWVCGRRLLVLWLLFVTVVKLSMPYLWRVEIQLPEVIQVVLEPYLSQPRHMVIIVHVIGSLQ